MEGEANPPAVLTISVRKQQAAPLTVNKPPHALLARFSRPKMLAYSTTWSRARRLPACFTRTLAVAPATPGSRAKTSAMTRAAGRPRWVSASITMTSSDVSPDKACSSTWLLPTFTGCSCSRTPRLS